MPVGRDDRHAQEYGRGAASSQWIWGTDLQWLAVQEWERLEGRKVSPDAHHL